MFGDVDWQSDAKDQKKLKRDAADKFLERAKLDRSVEARAFVPGNARRRG